MANAPLRLEDGRCGDLDSQDEGWGVTKVAGNELLCFASAGDNDRFVVNAAQIVNSARFSVSDQYADCEPGGKASGFVEIESRAATTAQRTSRSRWTPSDGH